MAAEQGPGSKRYLNTVAVADRPKHGYGNRNAVTRVLTQTKGNEEYIASFLFCAFLHLFAAAITMSKKVYKINPLPEGRVCYNRIRG